MLFPAAVPTQNTETSPDGKPDMWVHFSVRATTQSTVRLAHLMEPKTKGLCLGASVGDRRLALLQFCQSGFFKKMQQ